MVLRQTDQWQRESIFVGLTLCIWAVDVTWQFYCITRNKKLPTEYCPHG